MRLLTLTALICAAPALADPPTIETIQAHHSAGTWRFDVTLRHPDTGWDHYADGWRVLDKQGNVLGTRILHHPHEHEQPFTRSLSGVDIPDGVGMVLIEAKCSVDGWSSEKFSVTLK